MFNSNQYFSLIGVNRINSLKPKDPLLTISKNDPTHNI